MSRNCHPLDQGRSRILVRSEGSERSEEQQRSHCSETAHGLKDRISTCNVDGQNFSSAIVNFSCTFPRRGHTVSRLKPSGKLFCHLRPQKVCASTRTCLTQTGAGSAQTFLEPFFVTFIRKKTSKFVKTAASNTSKANFKSQGWVSAL